MIWCINSVTTNRVFFPGIFEPNEGGSPFRREWEVVAPQPGGQIQPPRCRTTGPPGTRAQIFSEIFFRKAPAARQRGGGGIFLYISRKKYIFIKNKIEKYKIKKGQPEAGQNGPPLLVWLPGPAQPGRDELVFGHHQGAGLAAQLPSTAHTGWCLAPGQTAQPPALTEEHIHMIKTTSFTYTFSYMNSSSQLQFHKFI